MLKFLMTLLMVYWAIGFYFFVSRGAYKVYASWGNPLQVVVAGFLTMWTWPFRDWRDPKEKR